MKQWLKRCFCWNITKDTGITLLSGALMIVLSVAMIPFSGEGTMDQIISFFLRDVFMILGLGFCFVTYYCTKDGENRWNSLGFRREKTKLSIILDVLFAAALIFIFISEDKPDGIFGIENLYGAVYVLVAGIFEMLFIYGFLRMGFEKSFGAIPAILLTSIFYSFHHAGFQPEFIRLFFVGIMYVSVYYITRNLLIIFPLFWGVGALWDVLVDSNAGDGIKNITSFLIAIVILLAMGIWWLYINKKGKRKECSQKRQL